MTILGLIAHELTASPPSWTPDGYILALSLDHRLRPADEFVFFGFTPTFHAKIARKTPFPYVDSWILLQCSGEAANDRYERLMGSRLAASVREPGVRCFIAQRHLMYYSHWREVWSERVVAKYVSDDDLRALGYTHSRIRMPLGTEYDLWMRPPQALNRPVTALN